MQFDDKENIELQIEQLRANRGKRHINISNDDDDMTLAKDEIPNKKDDGVMGVLTFQCIIAIVIAIIYVLLMTFNKQLAFDIKNTIIDKSANDFSFKDKVYKTVGDAITYLNEIEPISIGKDLEKKESEDTSSKDVVADDAADAAAADTKVKEDTPLKAEEKAEDGAGGEPNPVNANGMPADATFAPVIFTGRITFPLKDDYKVNSLFGFRNHPSKGIPEFHTAVDIGAPKGTPVMAAADGVVVKSEKGNSLGKYIIIDHSNDFYTVYGHCDKLLAKVGAHIREGEIIAKVGSTGDSTGNHLHFGMKKDGLFFDPSYIFKDEIDAKV